MSFSCLALKCVASVDVVLRRSNNLGSLVWLISARQTKMPGPENVRVF